MSMKLILSNTNTFIKPDEIDDFLVHTLTLKDEILGLKSLTFSSISYNTFIQPGVHPEVAYIDSAGDIHETDWTRKSRVYHNYKMLEDDFKNEMSTIQGVDILGFQINPEIIRGVVSNTVENPTTGGRLFCPDTPGGALASKLSGIPLAPYYLQMYSTGDYMLDACVDGLAGISRFFMFSPELCGDTKYNTHSGPEINNVIFGVPVERRKRIVFDEDSLGLRHPITDRVIYEDHTKTQTSIWYPSARTIRYISFYFGVIISGHIVPVFFTKDFSIEMHYETIDSILLENNVKAFQFGDEERKI